MKLEARVWLAICIIMVCFAANSVITRYLVLVGQVSPFLVTVIRFLSGFVALIPLASLGKARFRHDKPAVRYWPGALFLGAYAFSISYGYAFISVAAGTFIFYTFVVVTMGAYSVAVDKEPATLRLVLGQLLGLLGVLIITFSRIGSVTLPGILMMAATGASWGLYSAYGKRFTITFSYTYNSFLILGAFGMAASMVLGFVNPSILTTISIPDLALLLYMGTISTALSYVLWNATVRKIPASLGGLVQLIVPVLAPIMGIIFLAEQVTATLVIGGGLVLLGIYLAGSKGAGAS